MFPYLPHGHAEGPHERPGPRHVDHELPVLGRPHVVVDDSVDEGVGVAEAGDGVVGVGSGDKGNRVT